MLNASHRCNRDPHQAQASGGLPAWDAVRTVGRGLMGGLLGVLIDALWPNTPQAAEDER
jgi:hypothetical protein